MFRPTLTIRGLQAGFVAAHAQHGQLLAPAPDDVEHRIPSADVQGHVVVKLQGLVTSRIRDRLVVSPVLDLSI